MMLTPEILARLIGSWNDHAASWYFPFNNGAIEMDHFAIEGRVMWEVWLHKHFWNEVKKGNIGLDPKKLFRREYVN